MKRITVFVCMVLIAALTLPMVGRADVIYEPFDSFYESHREECTYVSRSYTASGPNGTVTLYRSPSDPTVEKEYPNASVLYVSYTYQTSDGVLWGCCENWEDDVTGWVPMAYLELIYDEQSFSEEHRDAIVPVRVTLEAAELDGKTVYFWAYPGSRDYIEVELTADYLPEFQESYTDENGVQWLRCGYYMGIKGKWVNLSNPTADYETLFPNAPAETVPAQTEPAPIETMEEIKPAGTGLKLIVTVAVAAVVIVTAVLLIALKKKKE